jgi:hypothetical protein
MLTETHCFLKKKKKTLLLLLLVLSDLLTRVEHCRVIPPQGLNNEGEDKYVYCL